jgi:hypothetical protein
MALHSLSLWLLNLAEFVEFYARGGGGGTIKKHKWQHKHRKMQTHIHASNGIQINDAKVRALEDSTHMQGHCAR